MSNEPAKREPTWSEVYAAFFRPLSPSIIETWVYELSIGPAKIRNYSDVMLKEAIRRLSKRKDRDGNTKTPGLEDVKHEMFDIMRESREASAKKAGANVECGMCRNSGHFLDVPLLYAGDKQDVIVGVCSDPCACLTDQCDNKLMGTVCYDVAVPCTCAIGQQAYRTGKYQNHGAIKLLQGMMTDALNRRANHEPA
jgi:hypothetical protein